jgi:hypothetical protein
VELEKHSTVLVALLAAALASRLVNACVVSPHLQADGFIRQSLTTVRPQLHTFQDQGSNLDLLVQSEVSCPLDDPGPGISGAFAPTGPTRVELAFPRSTAWCSTIELQSHILLPRLRTRHFASIR